MTTYLVEQFPTINAKVLGLDIETTQHAGPGTDSDPFRDDIVTIQLSDGKDAWVMRNPAGFGSIAPIMADPDVVKILHNAFFDLQFLEHHLGARVNKHSLWDSLLVERVINAGGPLDNGLAATAARRVGVMIDKSLQQSFTGVRELSREQLEYAGTDVLHLPKIRELQIADVSANQLGRVVALENRIVPAVSRMSLRGVKFDPELWQSYIPQIHEALISIEGEIVERVKLPQQNTLFGAPRLIVNLNSPDQVLDLFAKLHLNIVKKDKDKKLKPTTDKNAIKEYLVDHPECPHAEFLEKYMEWKKWSHTLSTNYTQYINPVTGLIHCQWNQIKADTGRFSASDPNLQNVERPVPGRPNLRLLFLPQEGYVFVIMDYSQQEPRIFAQMSGDATMRKACLETDVYMAMSDQIPSHPIRQNTKTGVLAYLYGASPETLANRMNIPLVEAKRFAADVDKQYQEAKRYAGRIKDAALHSGQTRTLLGRVRKYPETGNKKVSPHVLNQIVNAPIQGSGADMLKLAIDKFDDIVDANQYDAGPALVVHDEMVVAARIDQADEIYYQLLGAMETAGSELCPDVLMPVEGKISDKWTK